MPTGTPASPPSEPRVVRVFVSSTFRDMQAEREELVKRVFPQLRKLCEERGVTWGEVDLRWGITDEQKAEGKVLPICLEEIQRCRPYFIGLLGERYGWVPGAIPEELVRQQPWLAKHRSHSVTELEILHGVLNNPQMADHAFFYFRDPAYIATLEPEQQAACREGPTPEDVARFGEAEALRRAERRRDRLAALKQQIRDRGFQPRENYPDPHALGQLVLRDLTAVIDRLYPAEDAPDPLDREAAEHEAFARSRARVYIGREADFQALDAHAAGDGPPLVVLGESGVGKSALLANWALRYRQAHPDVPLILHFIGASPHSADWAAMARRILSELRRHLGIQVDLPDRPNALRAAFATGLGRAAAHGRLVLILDALNQLEDKDQAPELPWLPARLGPSIRLIVSTLPGRALEELRRRGWPTLTVQPLDPPERQQLITDYLAQYTKSLSAERTARVAGAPQTANPLYLRALLEELRQFGVHEQLDARIAHYLQAPTIPELYERILQRYEQDYEGDRPHLVRDAMSALWAARHGLSEAELLDLLGAEGEPLPRAHWSPLYLAAEKGLVGRSGLVGFSHDYLREAVRHRYLPTEAEQRLAHRRLAEYFDQQDFGRRKLAELAWQLLRAGEDDLLREWLTYRSIFTALDRTNRYELLQYWLALGDPAEMVQAYQQSLGHWKDQLPDPQEQAGALHRLADFFIAAGQYAAAEPVLREALLLHQRARGPDHPDTAAILNTLAFLLKTQRKLDQAEPLYRRALAILEKHLGPRHPHTVMCRGNLGLLLEVKGDLDAAEPLLRQTVDDLEQTLGPEHPHTANSLNVLAGLLRTRGDFAAAEPLYRRAVDIGEKTLGHEHPMTLTFLYNLAQTLERAEKLDEATAIYRRVLAAREKALGPNHPDTANTLNNLANIAAARGDLDEAERLYRRALDITRAALGPGHPNTALSLNNLATLLQSKGDLAGAEALLTEAVALMEKAIGPDHPDTAMCLGNLAAVRKARGDVDGAEPLYRRALDIHLQGLGPRHTQTTEMAWSLFLLLVGAKRVVPASQVAKDHLFWLVERAPDTLAPKQRKIRQFLVPFLHRQ